MRNSDPRRVDAIIYIREATRMLEAAQTKRLHHTDMDTVRAAIQGLEIVERSLAGDHGSDDLKITTRLRQVAAAVKSCAEPTASGAYADVTSAVELFQAMIDDVKSA